MSAEDRDILPNHVIPTHYALSIKDIRYEEPFEYTGKVAIDLDISEPTTSITLNAIELELQSAEIVNDAGKRLEAASITYEEAAQRAKLVFKETISGKHATLTINFKGFINHQMHGFYRSRYKSTAEPSAHVPKEGDSSLMFSTQFESCDARRALPCFDEPNIKASFDFEIEIPDGLTAIGNMPAKETQAGKGGQQLVRFERTPKMSTYLLAWAFGDFEYVEAHTSRKYNGQQLPVRVYTTKGLKDQGDWALTHCHQIVDYFSDIFQIEYPLPKVDLLAVHEFSQGAMENWGLITYRTTAILFDAKTSDAKYKKRIAYVVAHELAHQWFGNLVTMDWWNELWLNESFATWVGHLAVDHLHPEWDEWSAFIAESTQAAFQLDALRASHPIEVPVKDAIEVEQIFDAISYHKGSSIIRMLSHSLRVETFLKGVAAYLKAHEYGNAKTLDLWNALSKASGQDVASLMDPWIQKIGFPVLTIAEEPGQITVRQSRFLATGDVKAEEDGTLWWIPLNLLTAASADKPTLTRKDTPAITSKEETIRDIPEAGYKINAEATGFYRTNYPPQRLTELGAQRDKFTTGDRIGLISDAAALAQSGDGTSAGLLSLCAQFQQESSYIVWVQLLSSLSYVRSVFSVDAQIKVGLNNFVAKLIGPKLTELGWEVGTDEDFLTGQLRALLISTATSVEDTSAIEEAEKRFETYQKGNRQAMHQDLRLAVLRAGVQVGGSRAYEFIKQEYLASTSGEYREMCLTAMARVQTPELLDDFMHFQFSDAVPPQDVHTGSMFLAQNVKVRDAFWTWIKEQWELVHGRLSGNPVAIGRYVRVSLNRFSTTEMEKELEAFFASKDTAVYVRSLVQAMDTVKVNARYRERDEGRVRAYLEAHGYM